MTETEGGLIPTLIENGGAADKAGLRGNKIGVVIQEQGGIRMRSYHRIPPKGGVDLIVGVNGQPVQKGEDFITLVEEHQPGEKIELDIIRGNKKGKLPVILGEPNDEEEGE